MSASTQIIEKDVSSKAMVVLAWLKGRIAEGQSCTAVIDVSRYEHLEQCAEALGVEEAQLEQWPNLYLDFAPEVKKFGPRLFTATLDDPAWERIVQQALRKQAASFLLSAASTEELRTHLKSLLKMQQPDGSQLIFRFQDVIVLTSVLPLLSNAQGTALLGPATVWMAPDICGNAVSMERVKILGPVPASFALSASQLQLLDTALRPATIIAQANDVDSALLSDLSACGQWKKIIALQQRANAQGLNAEQDVGLYCVLALQLPDDFDRTGPVAHALHQGRESGIGFSAAMDHVPVEEWRAWDQVLDERSEKETAK